MHSHKQKLIIISLLFANLWVFLYVRILGIINKIFPASSVTVFIRQEVAPEPFEIPLYIILTVLFILIIKLFYRSLERLIPQNIPFKVILTIILSVLFILNLGNYPMAHDTYPYSQINQPNYSLYLIFYLLPVSLIVLETFLLEKFINSKKILIFCFFLFITSIIAAATFEPKLPILGLDYSYFFGAIWETMQAKTIFTQASSQYGFLSILFLATLNKLNLISLWQLPYLVWIFYIIEYFLVFYIIYKITSSLTLGVISFFSLITLNYFSIYLPASMLPQIGPLRWIPLIIPIFLLLKIKKIDTKLLIVLISILSFWVVDNGISLIVSYIFTLIILYLSRIFNWQKCLKTVILFLISILAVLAILNLIHILFGLQPINILLVFSKLNQYAKAGYGMIPIPEKTYFWLVILVYFTSIIYFLKNTQKTNYNHQETRYKQLLLFSSNLSFFSSLYYVGRSHPSNLFVISPLFILNTFILLGVVFTKLETLKLKIAFTFLIFFLMIVFPAYNRQEIIANLLKERLTRYKAGSIFNPSAEEFLKNKYEKEVELIKREFKEKKILILSDDDTYLFPMINKTSLLYDNPQVTILTTSDVDFSLQEVFRTCPKKLVGDCRLFGKCSTSYPHVLLYAYIQPYLFNRIEDVCKIKYMPKDCTRHMCIGVSR